MTFLRSFVLVAFAGVAIAGAVAPRSSADHTRAATGSAVIVAKSRYGAILFDGRGYALYSFTRDPRGRATCYGACAKAWPPYVVRARPSARKGAKASLIGTTRRRDGGLQATYGGRPIYHYRGDNAPGVILCQNVSEFGGLWLVLRATGTPVR